MREEKYFCDRCRKEMRKESVITIDMDINRSLFERKPNQGIQRYDLCESCYKSMHKFLSGAALDISEMGK